MSNTLARPAVDSIHDSGPITAGGLLRRRARQKTDAIALVDPPNRQALSLSAPYRLTYAEADMAADALAATFLDLGLAPGDRVVFQLPNFIEMPLALIGAWRAGLTAATIPMLWRANEIASVCDAIEPAALIGISRFADDAPADLLRDVATTRPAVRFVLSFGPNVPVGVVPLSEAMLGGAMGAPPAFAPRGHAGPDLITFSARENSPLVPLYRNEDEILAQGAMAVLSLSLDRRDVILNAYPFTGPIGLGTGLAPWLIGGATLVQHDPFEHGVLVQQILTAGATVTALPGSVLEQLAKDDVFTHQHCRLRCVGRVWSVPELAQGRLPPSDHERCAFDLYPLGDLASLLLRTDDNPDRASLPCGRIDLGDGEDGTAFIETKLAGNLQDVSIRGPVMPIGSPAGPAAMDADGFVSTGLYAQVRDGRFRVAQNPALIYHGGFTIAASELDGLYQAFPGYLDAACFALPDPVVGDRIFAAVAPSPDTPVSLEALHSFLAERGVAPYKFPDKLLIVRNIPRGAGGEIRREEILRQL